MSQQDVVIGAICAWRENRSGGTDGMQSVLNVLANRAKQRRSTIYAETVRKWQFSSMTALGDPQLILFPPESDAQWIEALQLAELAAAGTLADITGGATSYYAESMSVPPPWAASMTPTVTIQGQRFFK